MWAAIVGEDEVMWAAIVGEDEGVTEIYGPFKTQSDASAFALAEREKGNVATPTPLVSPPRRIHPNQSTIADYIDPSVAN